MNTFPFRHPSGTIAGMALLITALAVGCRCSGRTDAYTVFRVDTTGAAYATIADALAAARSLRASAPDAAVRIEIGSGTYYLAEPLHIGAELSGTAGTPTEIVAAPHAPAPPRLLAGRSLKLHWQPYREGILQATVEGPVFDRLFMNGKAQVRARYPNYDANVLPFHGYAADAIAPSRTAYWAHPEGGVLHALQGACWGSEQQVITGRSADGSLSLGPVTGNNRPTAPHERYRYVENVFEELDAPGEWFLDARTSTLYYAPPAGIDPATALFEASGAPCIFYLQGTAQAPLQHLRIAGLFLGHTATSYLRSTEPLLRSDWSIAREGAVLLEHTADVTVADNELALLGGNAVFVSGQDSNVRITGNHIHDIGASAIAFVGRPDAVRSACFNYDSAIPSDRLDTLPGPRSNDHPVACTAADNLIHDIGESEKQATGVEISMAMDITVTHNSIYRTPRAGINIGEGAWGGHVIAFNDVFATVLETGDHGAFNSWGRDRYWHPRRSAMDSLCAARPGLWRMDVLRPITVHHNRFQCEHGWDIDLDDGSSNYRIHDNVLLSGGLKFREGFDREAWNNVLLGNGFHAHVWFAHSGDRFVHNIVEVGHQPVLIAQWDAVVDSNLFPTEGTLQQAQALGLDRHSRFGEAGFLDPAQGDFRVKPDSPALAIGFHNFDVRDAGVTSARLRALAERPVMHPSLPLATALADTFEVAGARVKTLSTEGERSVAGLAERPGVLVLGVSPESPAGASGLRAGDVIVGTVASSYFPAEAVGNAADLVRLYAARRWNGGQEVLLFRDQRERTLEFRFTP